MNRRSIPASSSRASRSPSRSPRTRAFFSTGDPDWGDHSTVVLHDNTLVGDEKSLIAEATAIEAGK